MALSIGEIIYEIYPFCSNNDNNGVPVTSFPCYASVDVFLLLFLIGGALSLIIITSLRQVRETSGEKKYWFSIGSLFLTLIGFVLLGVNHYIFIIGILLFLSSLILKNNKK